MEHKPSARPAYERACGRSPGSNAQQSCMFMPPATTRGVKEWVHG